MKRLLAITLCLIGVASAGAQIVSPDTLVSPPPAPPAAARPTPPVDLDWLWQFTEPEPKGNKSALLADPRWATMLQSELKAPQAIWGVDRPLSDAIAAFLVGPGQVRMTKNRYLTVTGCVADQCGQRGLLWFDLGTPNPLVIFSALRWNEISRTTDDPKAPFTLVIFPSKNLDVQHIPQPFKQALAAWVYGPDYSLTPNIVQSVLVDTNGGPHVLQPTQIDIYPNTKNE